MTKISYHPLPTKIVQALRSGGKDAYGCTPERVTSEGSGNPCRHCLDFVPDGDEMLILAHRPFDAAQPYAETGPIFLCGHSCAPWTGSDTPPILRDNPDYLLKGYTSDQRILYGSGKIVDKQDVADYATALLENLDIAFVDVRSARNNCFQLRIQRA